AGARKAPGRRRRPSRRSEGSRSHGDEGGKDAGSSRLKTPRGHADGRVSVMELNLLLRRAVELGASDIHLKVGVPPILRRDGALSPLEDTAILLDTDMDALTESGRAR